MKAFITLLALCLAGATAAHAACSRDEIAEARAELINEFGLAWSGYAEALCASRAQRKESDDAFEKALLKTKAAFEDNMKGAATGDLDRALNSVRTMKSSCVQARNLLHPYCRWVACLTEPQERVTACNIESIAFLSHLQNGNL
jgi:hypothetical protein